MTQRRNSFSYEELFNLSPEILETEKQGIAEYAFLLHLTELGKARDRGIDYLSGNTDVSVPAYFAEAAKTTQSKFQTKTNKVAIRALPAQHYQPSYSRDREVSSAVYFEARRGSTAEDAIQHGKAAEWLVGQTVYVPHKPETHAGRTLSGEIVQGLNDSIVQPLPIMATRVKEAGYEDFLDYLVDARRQLGAIVETIFEHGPLRAQ